MRMILFSLLLLICKTSLGSPTGVINTLLDNLLKKGRSFEAAASATSSMPLRSTVMMEDLLGKSNSILDAMSRDKIGGMLQRFALGSTEELSNIEKEIFRVVEIARSSTSVSASRYYSDMPYENFREILATSLAKNGSDDSFKAIGIMMSSKGGYAQALIGLAAKGIDKEFIEEMLVQSIKSNNLVRMVSFVNGSSDEIVDLPFVISRAANDETGNFVIRTDFLSTISHPSRGIAEDETAEIFVRFLNELSMEYPDLLFRSGSSDIMSSSLQSSFGGFYGQAKIIINEEILRNLLRAVIAKDVKRSILTSGI